MNKNVLVTIPLDLLNKIEEKRITQKGIISRNEAIRRAIAAYVGQQESKDSAK